MNALPERQLQPIENLLTDSWDILLWENTKRQTSHSFKGIDVKETGGWARILRFALHRFPILEDADGMTVDMPLYRIKAGAEDLTLYVDAGASRSQALDALEEYRRDMGLSEKSPLSGSEIAELEAQGRAAIQGKEILLVNYSDEELRNFVRGYCDGRIYTSNDVPPDMLYMVFMPLMLGAMNFPEEVQKHLDQVLPQHPGEKPSFDEPEPKDDPPPTKPAKPDPPYQEDIQRWERQCAALDDAIEAVGTANRIRREQWEQRKAAVDNFSQTDWERKTAAHEAAQRGARVQYWKDLGIFWESTDEFTFPRSINGYPMFASVRMMSQSDWERARKAIHRELEHRKNMEI